jgi:hypothetical protein
MTGPTSSCKKVIQFLIFLHHPPFVGGRERIPPTRAKIKNASGRDEAFLLFPA